MFPGRGTNPGDTIVWDGNKWTSAAGAGSLTAPVDPTDDGKIAAASAGDLTYTNDISITSGTFSSHVAAGSGTVADAGAIRLAADQYIYWRDLGDTANYGIRFEDTGTRIRITADVIGDGAIRGAGIVSSDNALAVGSSGYSTTGSIRLLSSSNIKARNTGNTANLTLLQVFVDDLYLGSDPGATEGVGNTYLAADTAVHTLIGGSTIVDFTANGINFFGGAELTWSSGLPFANITHSVASSGAGGALTITAQGTNDAVAAAGDVIITSGTNAGAGADGEFRIQRGGVDYITSGNGSVNFSPNGNALPTNGTVRFEEGSTLYIKGTGTNGIQIVRLVSDVIYFGSTSSSFASSMQLEVPSGRVIVFTAPTEVLRLSPTIITVTAPDLVFSSIATTPDIYQADDATASATGDLLTIHAQDATGTTSTGGTLALRAGTGTSASGVVRIGTGSVANSIEVGQDTAGPTGFIRMQPQGGNLPNTATAGILLGYGTTIVAGNNAGTGDIDIFSVGVVSTDYVRFGNGIGSINFTGSVSTWGASGGLTLANAASCTGASFSVNYSGKNVSLTNNTITIATLSGDDALIRVSDATTATYTGQLLTIRGQDCSGTTSVTGGKLLLRAGDATGASGTRNGGHMLIRAGQGATTDGNIALHADPASWQSMERGLFLGDAATVPSGDPTAGGFLFVESGALKYRGSSGTSTTVAPA